MNIKRFCAITGLIMFVAANIIIGYSVMNPGWSLQLPWAVYAVYIIIMALCLFVALRKENKQ